MKAWVIDIFGTITLLFSSFESVPVPLSYLPLIFSKVSPNVTWVPFSLVIAAGLEKTTVGSLFWPATPTYPWPAARALGTSLPILAAPMANAWDPMQNDRTTARLACKYFVIFGFPP